MVVITPNIHLCIENIKNIACKVVRIENIWKVHRVFSWYHVTHLDSLEWLLSNVFLHVKYENINTMSNNTSVNKSN